MLHFLRDTSQVFEMAVMHLSPFSDDLISLSDIL